MKTKTLLYGSLLGCAMAITSCSDFTEVQPKGKNLLSTTTELEMLLNNEFSMTTFDMDGMCRDKINSLQHIPTMLANPTPTRASIMLSWDESKQDKMAELTSSDTEYTTCYEIIGRIANPILSHVGSASGDEQVKKQLRAEALVLRAYFHYLLVNKFAKAYNPATAAEDPGIPYVTEEQDITQPTVKETVQGVYDHILADVQEAIDLNALPYPAVNRMRMSEACAHAVKALALLSMQRFEEAKQAAKDALALNGTVDNYNNMLTTKTNSLQHPIQVLLRPRMECAEDLFYVYNLEFYRAISLEALARFEEGHVVHDHMDTDCLEYEGTYSMAESMMGLSGDYWVTFDLSSGWNSTGLKTTHMYLIVAEAEIHAGHYDEAMKALDAIRVNRINPDVYAPLEGTVTTEADAIAHLKQTSHGENIYSCYNFINRKRWNQLDGYKETLTRDIAGTVYTLTPDSPMWIFPFPQNAVNNNPNLTQNYKEL